MRKHPRIPVIMLVQGEGLPLPVCFTKDISRGGLFLETVTPLPTPQEAVGKELNLSFCLPYSTRPVKARAKIVRVKSEANFENKEIHGLGLEFLSPGPELLAEIDNYIQKTSELQEESLSFMSLPTEEVLEVADETAGPYFAFKGIEYYDAATNRLLASEGEAVPANEHPHLAALRDLCGRLSPAEKLLLLRRDDHFSSLPDGDRKFLLELLLHLVKLECEALLMPKYLLEGGRYSRQLQSEALKVERETLLREQKESELYQRIQKGKEIRVLGEYEKLRQHFQKSIRLFRENVIQRGEESLFEEAMPPDLKKLFDSVEPRDSYQQLLIDYHGTAELGRIERAKVAKFMSDLDPFEVSIISGEAEVPERDLLVQLISLYWKITVDSQSFNTYPGDLYLFRKKLAGVYQRSAGEAGELAKKVGQVIEALDPKKEKELRQKLSALLDRLQQAESAFGNFVNRVNAQGESVPGVELAKEPRRRRRFRLFGGGKEEKRAVGPAGVRKKPQPAKSHAGRTLFLVFLTLVLGGIYAYPYIKTMMRDKVTQVDFPVPIVFTAVVNDEVKFTAREADLQGLGEARERKALDALLVDMRNKGFEGINVFNENGQRIWVTYHRGEEAYLAKAAIADMEKGSLAERAEKQRQMRNNPEEFMKSRRAVKGEKKEQKPAAGSRFNIPGFTPPAH